ncbi:MAG: hypothetical protein KJ905_01225 [Nanoarchaeota archaeon]|nr:hypothetical protein [Nanoarchaeota archaeon]MBU1501381.1 hypothetical protein [Nanoarchaeota archaeon]
MRSYYWSPTDGAVARFGVGPWVFFCCNWAQFSRLHSLGVRATKKSE